MKHGVERLSVRYMWRACVWSVHHTVDCVQVPVESVDMCGMCMNLLYIVFRYVWKVCMKVECVYHGIECVEGLCVRGAWPQ